MAIDPTHPSLATPIHHTLETSPCSSHDALLDFARTLRLALEPGLAKAHDGAVIADGSCLYAALLVVVTVHRFRLGTASVHGGSGFNDQGVIDPIGRWHGHYWSEVVSDDGAAFIVDLTADQFGWTPVVVIPSTLAASRYRPGDQPDVDDALLDLASELGCIEWLATPQTVSPQRTA